MAGQFSFVGWVERLRDPTVRLLLGLIKNSPSHPLWRLLAHPTNFSARTNKGARTTTIAAAVGLALAGSAASAAQVTWDDESCRYTVTFDAKKVDAAALRNTVKLLFDQSPLSPTTQPYLLTPEYAAQADLAKTQRECDEVARTGPAMNLLALPGIEEYRTALLDDARDKCELMTAEIRAVKDAAALRDYKPAAPACTKFIDALEGKAELDRAWRETIEASCRDNASPAACRSRSLREAEAPDGAERKRLLVLNFGWSNCAIRLTRGYTFDKERAAQRTALEKKFKSQFKVKQSRCQNPG